MLVDFLVYCFLVVQSLVSVLVLPSFYFLPPLPPSQGSDRAVRHFQFLAWPDYGVPTSGSAVLDLISAVRDATATTRPAKPSASSTAEQQRVIVHCSAGVGRSGAFCVINNCIDEFRERGTVNVQGAVRALRLQRAYAIQTDEQYDFCYRTILHFMKSHAN